MIMMEVGLHEQIPPSWQEGGNRYQKLQKVREPRVLRPKRSHQGELQSPRLQDLCQDSRNEAERREGISLKTVPTLEQGIGACRLWIHHWQKVHREMVVEGRSKEIDGGWSLVKKLTKSLGTQGPLGANDFALAAQGIREDIQLARNELGKELNVRGLAQAENHLSHRIESGRSSATLFLEVRQGRGVEHRHHTTTERRKEPADSEQNCKELPVIDGKSGAQGRPRAGEMGVPKGGTPASVRSVCELKQVWKKLP